MEKYNVYKDISTRTGGDIYIGVVGPVRTGKSTFITKFVEKFILPNISNKLQKQIATDEMPQSADGKTIMTTQPKFVPNDAVKIQIGDNSSACVRLVDCVGYAIDGANGFMEEEGVPRFVKTPWCDEEIPFVKAAEIGTSKVINEHSTIAVLVTTDGSITGIERENYQNAEERVVRELENSGKPYIILLNTVNPNSQESHELINEIRDKYNTTVIAKNIESMTQADIDEIIELVLKEFYVSEIKIELPSWVRALPHSSALISSIMDNVRKICSNINKMKDIENALQDISAFEEFNGAKVLNVDYGTGVISFAIEVSKELFYKMLSLECGVEIPDDFYLMSYMKHLTHAKAEYDKLKDALDKVKETGYGVVVPTLDEMTLEEPKITKKGNNSQVKLKATAPSLHIMRVDVETEVCPAVGSAEQSENLAKFMLSEFESNPQGIWQTNMFGKPLSSFVCEGITSKINNIPNEAQVKMRKTMTKIVNEGKGGIICILL